MRVVDMTVIDRTRASLKALGTDRGPIIVGPWLSEIGFEVLYWIPFLRWACAYAGLAPEDLWIVSRGGARSWYQDIGAHYVDVLDFYTPDEFRAGDARRIAEQAKQASGLGLKPHHRSTKQHTRSFFDEEILARVCASAGLVSPRVLHPSLMYAFFRPFWRRKAGYLYNRSTMLKRLQPSADGVPGLPSSYVAMKFYVSAALPDIPKYRKIVQEIVETQAKASDVVLLHSGTRYDDHGEFQIDTHPRVHRIALPPSQNLDLQTSVIARASSFVGTYGGFAYVAPFLGVPTLALYGQANFRRDHRDLMSQIAKFDLKVPFAVEQLQHGRSLVAKRAVRRAA